MQLHSPVPCMCAIKTSTRNGQLQDTEENSTPRGVFTSHNTLQPREYVQYDVMMWFVLWCCLCLSSFQPVSSQGAGVFHSLFHILVRAHAHGPSSQPTDATDHTMCSLCSDPCCDVLPCHNRMCVAERLGFRWRHVQAHSVFEAIYVRKPRSKKLEIISVET